MIVIHTLWNFPPIHCNCNIYFNPIFPRARYTSLYKNETMIESSIEYNPWNSYLQLHFLIKKKSLFAYMSITKIYQSVLVVNFMLQYPHVAIGRSLHPKSLSYSKIDLPSLSLNSFANLAPPSLALSYIIFEFFSAIHYNCNNYYNPLFSWT